MAQTITIYSGLKEIAKRRNAALKREAKRRGKSVSVSDVIWDTLMEYGSPELRADLQAAEKERI